MRTAVHFRHWRDGEMITSSMQQRSSWKAARHGVVVYLFSAVLRLGMSAISTMSAHEGGVIVGNENELVANMRREVVTLALLRCATTAAMIGGVVLLSLAPFIRRSSAAISIVFLVLSALADVIGTVGVLAALNPPITIIDGRVTPYGMWPPLIAGFGVASVAALAFTIRAIAEQLGLVSVVRQARVAATLLIVLTFVASALQTVTGATPSEIAVVLALTTGCLGIVTAVLMVRSAVAVRKASVNVP